MVGDNNGTTKTFVAGDVRAAEHPGLSALHILFVREHNRICDRLKREGISGDEETYQRARKEVGALIQTITYQEFLPALGVKLDPFRRYNPNVRPDITNIFATAAYRFGHSLVADEILLKDNHCEDVDEGHVELLEVFFNTATVQELGLNPILKGLASHKQYEMDLKVNSVLRDMLFGDTNSPALFGLDLASLNIQRGRDHGLPDYNKVRRYYTGSTARTFADITLVDSTLTRLRHLYGNVNDMDLWVGLLAEDQLPNKSVGKTLHAILKAQFENLRDGDFYSYLNDPFLGNRVRNVVKSTLFSDIIKRNTDITNLQANVFFAEECPELNPVMVTELRTQPKNLFSIFPNPVKDFLTITTGKDLGTNVELEVSTMDGTVVKTIKYVKNYETFKLDMTSFNAGTYFMSLKYKDGVITKKFIKL